MGKRFLIFLFACGLLMITIRTAAAQGLPMGPRLPGARVSWNPARDLLAVGNDTTLTILNATTQTPLLTLPPLDNMITSVDWSPDGTRLAASAGYAVYIWAISPQVDAASLIQTLHAINDDLERDYEISQIQWHPSEDQLLGVNFPNALIWDLATGNVIETLAYSRVSITTAAWSPDGSKVAVGGMNTTVTIRDIASGDSTVIRTRESSDPIMISALAWSLDSYSLATAGIEDFIRTWSLYNGPQPHEVAHFPYNTQAVFALAWIARSFLAIGGEGQTLWIWDVGMLATPVALAVDGPVVSLDWSPDGSQLAYGSPSGLTVIDLPPAVTSLTAATATPPPASAYEIVFVSERMGIVDVYAMEIDGSSVHPLVSLGWDIATAACSPDGRHVATDPISGEIAVTDVANSTTTTVIAGLFIEDPAYSPDGTRIAFHWINDNGSQIYIMNADGSDVIQLTHASGSNRFPNWSPDGRRIAFSSERNQEPGIFVIDVDGTHETRLTTNPHLDMMPVWSPDGSRIGFTRYVEDGATLYTMNPDGSDLVALTGPGDSYNWGLSWSPDSSRIAFTSTRDGNQEVYLMDADGGNPTRLTNDSALDESRCWLLKGSDPLASPPPTP